MNAEDRVAELLAEALDRLDRGATVDLPALCREQPELLLAVAGALGLRGDLRDLQRAGGSAEDRAGSVLTGRYRLDSVIGRGAAGTVFRARDLRLQRDVAVKLLHAGAFGSPEATARFRREAEVLAQHAHRHVVAVHDQGVAEDGALFLVTELLQGCSLQEVLERSRAVMPGGPSAAAFAAIAWLREVLPGAALERSYLRQVVSWIVQLAGGLGEAHAAGVCHRDVKPSNVFVRADGSAVLLDFGIAVRAGDPTVTLPHAIVGTPCYMAPEQARGQVEPSPSIDVYGLAATLYHLVTLRPPHAGDLASVLAAVRTLDPTPASVLHEGLPRDLQAILDHGLERDPRQRYRDVHALAADLQAFLDHRPVSVRPLGAVRRALRSCRRQPARAFAGLLGVAVACLLLVVAPLAYAAAAHAARTEQARLLAHLPADLCIEGRPEERLLVPLAERGRVIGELDRLLELDPGDRMVHVLRAAERLDAGDARAASDDFAALQRLADSPYLAAVAARYAATAARGGSSRDVDLAGLPAPVTTTDAFVAGFHAMRAHDFEGAHELLCRCVDFVPARDLRLLAACGRRKPEPEALLAEAGWLEGHYGRPTARTRHAMAVAMLLLRRYDAAIGYCEDSLRLRPDRHGPWNNLGLAHLRSGDPEAAKRCYERAVELRPWFANSLGGLAQTRRLLGDFAGAEAAARRIEDECWREHELGNLAVGMAIAAAAGGDDAGRRAHAGVAAVRFRAAMAVPAEATRNPRQRSLPAALAYAEVLAGPEPAAATLGFLRQLQADPLNARQVANLAGLLRNHAVDDRCRAELCLLLLEIAAGLAPGDAQLRAGRDALRAEVEAKDR